MNTPEISRIEQKVEEKASAAETAATSAALSAVNGEKSWLSRNWKQLAGFALALLTLVYIVHKL